MKSHRTKRAIACLHQTAVLLPLISNFHDTPAKGLSISCDPLERRVVRADAIVAGYTSSLNMLKPRPHVVILRPEFQIREVIKGTHYHAGDVHRERGSPQFFGLGGPHLPDPRSGCSVVFLHKGLDGQLRSQYCHTSCSDLQSVRRMSAVAADPRRYLNSAHIPDRHVILYWIEHHYAPRPEDSCSTPSLTPAANLSRQEGLEFIRRCVDEPINRGYRLELDLLCRFKEPEDFDRFIRALRSDFHHEITLGARGLEGLSDSRALPILSLRLQQMQRDRDILIRNWTRILREEGLEDASAKASAASDYDQSTWAVSRAIDLIARRNHSPLMRCSLALGISYEEASAAEIRSDATIVERALARFWSGTLGEDYLREIDDPRINQQARERMYDDPRASRLLARRGDPLVRDFMLRLLDQGHADGARWAAATLDSDACGNLLTSFHRMDRFAWIDFPYAMGRCRVFEGGGLLINTERFVTPGVSRIFLHGLLNISPEDTRLDPTLISEDEISQKVWAIAEREGWSSVERDTVRKLIEFPQSQAARRAFHPGWSWPWTPPETLPDLPDPHDQAALRQYWALHRDKVIISILISDEVDKATILYSLGRARITLPDDLVVDCLLDASSDVRRSAMFLLSDPGGRIRMRIAPIEVRRWALEGDADASRLAILYIGSTCDTRYGPTLVELVRRGLFLFDSSLFDAIVRTRADGCIPLLTSYLDREHIDLRRRAAVTLAMFGNDAGRRVLLQEEQRLSQLHGQDLRSVNDALKQIGR